MKRQELFSRLLIAAAMLGVVAIPVFSWVQTPLIHVRMAENGGWNPDLIQAKVGQPLRLKFTSDDVMHGFAVGQMEMQPVDIEPGKVSETTLTFTKPGIYTFFCTRWCGLNHWRMRGTIEVSGGTADLQPAKPPLYVTLGLDLDAPHPAKFFPTRKPSAQRGAALLSHVQIDLNSDYYRAHSPTQVFQDLSQSELTEMQRWDVVAALWQSNTTSAGIAEGQRLFAQNCAACHGETGDGHGVFAEQLAAAGAASTQGMSGASEMSLKKPVNFTSIDLLGASPALLQGKMLRGGMGTGMPMWGSIFTDEQLWNLVAYLYTFHFEP